MNHYIMNHHTRIMGQSSSSGAALSIVDEGLRFQAQGRAGSSRACCDVLNCETIGEWDEFAKKERGRRKSNERRASMSG